jgi:hypothetical protein
MTGLSFDFGFAPRTLAQPYCCKSMKAIFTILLGLTVATCSAAGPRVLVADPVAAIRKVLPKSWEILKVEHHTYPFYRPKGDGKAVFLGIAGKKYSKEQFSAVLYIMPADYQDGGDDPTHGEAASWPARLVATTKDAKLYLWPGPQSEDWKTMQEDLVKTVTTEERTIR